MTNLKNIQDYMKDQFYITLLLCANNKINYDLITPKKLLEFEVNFNKKYIKKHKITARDYYENILSKDLANLNGSEDIDKSFMFGLYKKNCLIYNMTQKKLDKLEKLKNKKL